MLQYMATPPCYGRRGKESSWTHAWIHALEPETCWEVENLRSTGFAAGQQALTNLDDSPAIFTEQHVQAWLMSEELQTAGPQM